MRYQCVRAGLARVSTNVPRLQCVALEYIIARAAYQVTIGP